MSKSVNISVFGLKVRCFCDSEVIVQSLLGIYPQADDSCADSGLTVKFSLIKGSSNQAFVPANYQVSDFVLEASLGLCWYRADRHSMSGEALLTLDMLKNEYLFRHQILYGIFYFLLSYELFTPIHCACFVKGDAAVLLVGKGGAGKSTLAWNALRRGYKIVAEDLCFIGGKSEPYLVSDCREIHVLPMAKNGVNNVEKMELEQTHNGKWKQIVSIEPSERQSRIKKVMLVFIQPRHSISESSISEVNSQNIFSVLEDPEEEGFNLLSNNRERRIEWLKETPSYLANIGFDMNLFFSELDRVVGEKTHA